MNYFRKKYDCVIIGGGMFGLYATSFLSSKGARVAILEKEKSIFNRASKINQARIHRGYHYPRSFETAKKVSNYYHRFCKDFNFAILKRFKQYYAISKKNSKTSVDSYKQFCKRLGLPLKEADSSLFFKKNRVSSTFEVEELCFDYLKIKEFFLNQFTLSKNVDIYYKTFPISYKILNSKYTLNLNNTLIKLISPIVINATYSNVNMVNKLFGFSNYKIKYELCELKLCKMNTEFPSIGLIVMDGPFFSLTPFSKGNMFSLSSVNFTPIDISYINPQSIEKFIKKHQSEEKTETVARHYLKQNIRFKYKSSIFEIKPLLISSYKNDDRPTIIKIHSKNPFFVSILAGKISTIYDLDEILDKVLNLISS